MDILGNNEAKDILERGIGIYRNQGGAFIDSRPKDGFRDGSSAMFFTTSLRNNAHWNFGLLVAGHQEMLPMLLVCMA